MRRLLLTTLVAALAATTAVACTSAATPDDVRVTGAEGERPALAFTTPLEVGDGAARVVWAGHGDPLADGGHVLVHTFAENARDGAVVADTYGGSPVDYRLTPDSLGQALYEALSGQRVGARVLALAPALGSASQPLVAVLDVLPTRAEGTPVEVRDGLPAVTRAADGAPSVAVVGGDAPTALVVQPLLRGAGPQVAAGQTVTVQYHRVDWATGDVLDTSWGAGPGPTSVTLGSDGLLPELDEGLVEQTVGSQVMLVIPADSASGQAASILVVDVLAAAG